MGFRDFPGKFGIFLYFMENFGISPKKNCLGRRKKDLYLVTNRIKFDAPKRTQWLE